MNWINFFVFAFLAACLELAFQEYQQPKMIFDWYRNMLVNWSKDIIIGQGNDIKRPMWKKKVALVLGLCPYCNGFWIAVTVFFLAGFHWPYLLLFTGLNYVCIRFIQKFIIWMEIDINKTMLK